MKKHDIQRTESERFERSGVNNTNILSCACFLVKQNKKEKNGYNRGLEFDNFQNDLWRNSHRYPKLKS